MVGQNDHIQWTILTRYFATNGLFSWNGLLTDQMLKIPRLTSWWLQAWSTLLFHISAYMAAKLDDLPEASQYRF